MRSRRSPRWIGGAPVAVVLGLLVFAAGLLAAGRVLPEWQLENVPERSVAQAWFVELATALELEPVGEARPKTRLVAPYGGPRENPFLAYGSDGARALIEGRRPAHLRIEGRHRIADVGEIDLQVELDLDGGVQAVHFERPFGPADLLQVQFLEPPPRPKVERIWDDLPAEAFVPVDGDEDDDCCLDLPFVDSADHADRAGSAGRWSERLVVDRHPVESSARRLPAAEENVERRTPWWGDTGFRILLWLGLLVATGLGAFVLALRRRIDLRHGLLFGGVVLGVDLLSWAVALDGGRPPLVFILFAVLVVVGVVVLGWSAAESWLVDLQASRRGVPDRTRQLATLTRGRLDHAVGRSLVVGLTLGAVTAGSRLLFHSLGVASGWFLPAQPSLELPALGLILGPLSHAVVQATCLLLAWAMAISLLPARVRLAAASLLAALVMAPFEWNLLSFGSDFLLALVGTLALSWAFRRAGSLALLAAAITAELLPVAAYALQAPSWLGRELAFSVAILAVVALVARAAWRRPTVRDAPRPAFLERLDTERRISYEMDLLERMQRGLLPAAPPRLVGWDLAARSMTAHRVGGDFYDFFDSQDGYLWIAAGDVAGHGSFCSLGHAMTKAALASLIRAGRTPGDVLGRLDRVLRELYGPRLFTALALVRLDPTDGSALYANAGFPYALVLTGSPGSASGSPGASGHGRQGRVRELERPGLPVGGGPPRSYPDVELRVEPGDALVFCSDGLFEAMGSPETAEHAAAVRPYGFTRPRRVLEASRRDTADGLLEEMLDDWRRFVRRERPEDDTTVLVVRRAA